MTRTPLAKRSLPPYSRLNELTNMYSHAAGTLVGLAVLAASIVIFLQKRDPWSLVSGLIYAVSLIALYSVSAVYHGLRPGMAKKVMQVIDHCTIYALIAGTYTPILLGPLRTAAPFTAWALLGAEWLLAVIGGVFTAIDHKKYGRFCMVCYLVMGWLLVCTLKSVFAAVGFEAMLLIFLGGLVYTVGAVIYGLGSKRPALHSVFHFFVLAGTLLQAAAVIFYIL